MPWGLGFRLRGCLGWGSGLLGFSAVLESSSDAREHDGFRV